MIRKSITIIIIVASMITLGTSWRAKADIGEMPMPGGIITPGDKIDNIQMKSEDVIFTIKDSGAQIFPNQPAVTYYAHVKASFVMRSLSSKPESKQLFFPFHAGLQAGSIQQEAQAKNAKVTVDDKSVDLKYKSDVFNSQNASVESGVFDANFTANGDTKIVVEYDLRAVNDAKSPNLAFSYMMITGSHWADKIGSGKVTFDFTQDISSLAPLAKINDFFKLKDGDLVWEFKDLEPTAEQDIKISFDPRALDIWGSRPAFIKSMAASRPQVDFYQSENIRAAGDYPGGIARSNMVNVLDYSSLDAGWLVDQKTAATNEWLQFDFGDEYTFDAVQILSGYRVEGFDDKTGKTQFYYDTYRRPKTVEVQAANNSTASTLLSDSPTDYQILKLPNGPTKSLRLNFKDAYSGTGGGDKAFAIGRVRFLGAKKVSAVGANPVSPAANATGLVDKYQNYIIAGFVLAVIGTSFGIIKLSLYLARRRKTRLAKNLEVITDKIKKGDNINVKK